MKARVPNNPQMNRAGLMKQVQDMQENMAKIQEKVENSEFISSVGGGAVEVTVNGKHAVTSIKLQPEIVDPDDVEMLEDLLMSAFNESVRKATEAMDQGMEQAKGGLSIPGLF